MGRVQATGGGRVELREEGAALWVEQPLRGFDHELVAEEGLRQGEAGFEGLDRGVEDLHLGDGDDLREGEEDGVGQCRRRPLTPALSPLSQGEGGQEEIEGADGARAQLRRHGLDAQARERREQAL